MSDFWQLDYKLKSLKSASLGPLSTFFNCVLLCAQGGWDLRTVLALWLCLGVGQWAKPAGNYRVRGRSCGCCLSFLSASSLGGGAVLLHLNITAPAGWPSPIVTDVTRFQWPLYPLPLGLCEFAYVILTCPILSVRMVWCVIHKPRQFWGIHSVSCQEDCFLSKQASQGAVSIQWWVYLGEVGRGAVKNWPCCPKMQNFEGSHQFQSSLWDGPLLWLHRGSAPISPQSCFLTLTGIDPKGTP